MIRYKLKKEAVQFFKEDHATSVKDFETWNKLNVDQKALEEIKEAHITFGHRDKDRNGSSLAGWCQENGSHFHFTINFPSIKMREHDQFSNGRLIRELMENIQSQLDCFYDAFANNEKN